jgi:hypothetical protein
MEQEKAEGQELIERLRVERPDVAIVVSRTIDMNFQWDGDGPDPAEDGLEPYDVEVAAITIRRGVVYEGTDHLGGSYFAHDEPIGEVHGYLKQMVLEALEELAVVLP